MGEAHDKYPILEKYANMVKDKLNYFGAYEIVHMPRKKKHKG